MSKFEFSAITTDDLIKEIHPEMDPEEVVARLREYNQREGESNPTQPLIDIARNKLLKYRGISSEEGWTFYSLNAPDKEQSLEEMMGETRKIFPEGVETLTVQGSIKGASTYDTYITPHYNKDEFSVFVRVKPPKLPDSYKL